MKLNGCYNRPKLRHTAIVQSGWINNFNSESNLTNYGTRSPRLITIADPMTKECQYQKLQKNDPKCSGCKHLEGTLVWLR